MTTTSIHAFLGRISQPKIIKACLFTLVAIVLLAQSSCKKYEDGPVVSLRSRSERVANNWKVGQAFDNGKDVTSDYDKYELALTKSGDASLLAKYKFVGSNYEYYTNGTWRFVSNEEKISFDFDNNHADGVYTILKLEESEMWLRLDGENEELHFVPR